MERALLVMDFQVGIVERFGERGASVLDRVNRAIGVARERGDAVIFVRVAFRPGTPEVSPSNVGFWSLTRQVGWEEGSPTTALHPSLQRLDSDVVVVKRRVSAFTGSDLEVVLRSLGVRQLTLAGISTSGVVLSTLRAAADLDYSVSVLSDACLDADDEVHRVLVEKVFPRQATVVTHDEWASRAGS